MSGQSHKSRKSHRKSGRPRPAEPTIDTYRISSATAKGWRPRAELAYRRIKNKVQSICGLKQGLQYLEKAKNRRVPLMEYFEYYYSERGANWARSMESAIYAQLIYQNYQVSRRSIQFAPRPILDLLFDMGLDENLGRGEATNQLDDQCIFIDIGNLGLETSFGDGIFLSVFDSTHALYCCIHNDDFYCGEISLELATSGKPFERPQKDLRNNQGLLKLVYLAWHSFGLLTGGLRLPDEQEFVIVQDLGEIQNHTPIRTVMSFDGFATLMQESTIFLNILIKVMRWGKHDMSELLDEMGLRGVDQYRMVQHTRFFFALQAWANSRQTFRIDLDSFRHSGYQHASELPLSFFDPDHLPYSSFYIEFTGYGPPDAHCGVLIAKSRELAILSGRDRPEIFLLFGGTVYSSCSDLEELLQYLVDFEEIPADFVFAAILAIIQVVKTSSEEFILRQVREVRSGKREKRDKFVVGETRDIKWFLNPRTTLDESKSEIKVPLDQLIPPSRRPERQRPATDGTRASPKLHTVRRHASVYWCGPGRDQPEIRWIDEYERGQKPTGVTIPAEVIHQLS